MDWDDYHAETELTPSEHAKAEAKYETKRKNQMKLKNHSKEGLYDERKEHTERTIEAIEILQEAFLEIQRLNLIIEDLRKRPVWVGSHLSN